METPKTINEAVVDRINQLLISHTKIDIFAG